jgi:hypothetical protein
VVDAEAPLQISEETLVAITKKYIKAVAQATALNFRLFYCRF